MGYYYSGNCCSPMDPSLFPESFRGTCDYIDYALTSRCCYIEATSVMV